MIISSDRLVKTPPRLIGGVLLLALGVIPLGVAFAQDYDAVERRLGKAVSKGELTLDQAKAMMDALRRVGRQGEGRSRRITREEYAKAEAKLKKLVEVGKVSGEDARKRLGEMRKMIEGRAQQQAMEAVIRVIAYDEKIVATVRTTQRFVVPRFTPGWGGNGK